MSLCYLRVEVTVTMDVQHSVSAAGFGCFPVCPFAHGYRCGRIGSLPLERVLALCVADFAACHEFVELHGVSFAEMATAGELE